VYLNFILNSSHKVHETNVQWGHHFLPHYSFNSFTADTSFGDLYRDFWAVYILVSIVLVQPLLYIELVGFLKHLQYVVGLTELYKVFV
jgi:hypothetical protein